MTDDRPTIPLSPRLAARYALPADRHYDAATHLWVDAADATRVRCGFDPLGAETCGDIVALSFVPPGTRVGRGEAFGSLEAAKFVGPLIAPLSGTVVSHNDAVLADPGLLNGAPLEHWLIELEPADAGRELAALLFGAARVRPWFEEALRRFREQGMIAE